MVRVIAGRYLVSYLSGIHAQEVLWDGAAVDTILSNVGKNRSKSSACVRNRRAVARAQSWKHSHSTFSFIGFVRMRLRLPRQWRAAYGGVPWHTTSPPTTKACADQLVFADLFLGSPLPSFPMVHFVHETDLVADEL